MQVQRTGPCTNQKNFCTRAFALLVTEAPLEIGNERVDYLYDAQPFTTLKFAVTACDSQGGGNCISTIPPDDKLFSERDANSIIISEHLG